MLQVYTQFKHLFLNDHSPTVPQNYFCHILHTFTHWSFGYIPFSEFYSHELQNKITEYQLNDNHKAITVSLFYTFPSSKKYSHYSQRNPPKPPFATSVCVPSWESKPYRICWCKRHQQLQLGIPPLAPVLT